ncbi:MAG TPA: type II toxin-antitoxin system RelE/ParE family toxin [Ramlibacter sp.]|nr:type II toxin-antitoxin system RelE/ParE family toxin [Ramlibacter sp.]
MKRARFSDLARAELLAEVAYYENRRPGLGARFRIEVEAASEHAAASPKSAPLIARLARRRQLPTFPFRIIYTETDYGILIHAVAHNRRSPAYWVQRLEDEA